MLLVRLELRLLAQVLLRLEPVPPQLVLESLPGGLLLQREVLLVFLASPQVVPSEQRLLVRQQLQDRLVHQDRQQQVRRALLFQDRPWS
jgi:hypothetical protein